MEPRDLALLASLAAIWLCVLFGTPSRSLAQAAGDRYPQVKSLVEANVPLLGGTAAPRTMWCGGPAAAESLRRNGVVQTDGAVLHATVAGSSALDLRYATNTKLREVGVVVIPISKSLIGQRLEATIDGHIYDLGELGRGPWTKLSTPPDFGQGLEITPAFRSAMEGIPKEQLNSSGCFYLAIDAKTKEESRWPSRKTAKRTFREWLQVPGYHHIAITCRGVAPGSRSPLAFVAIRTVRDKVPSVRFDPGRHLPICAAWPARMEAYALEVGSEAYPCTPNGLSSLSHRGERVR